MENTKALFVVVNSGFSEEIVDLARKKGARGATILSARGSGITVEKILGISVNAEKEIVLIIVDKEIADEIMDSVKESAGIASPAHGICFTLPVDRVTKLV